MAICGLCCECLQPFIHHLTEWRRDFIHKNLNVLKTYKHTAVFSYWFGVISDQPAVYDLRAKRLKVIYKLLPRVLLQSYLQNGSKPICSCVLIEPQTTRRSYLSDSIRIHRALRSRIEIQSGAKQRRISNIVLLFGLEGVQYLFNMFLRCIFEYVPTIVLFISFYVIVSIMW